MHTAWDVCPAPLSQSSTVLFRSTRCLLRLGTPFGSDGDSTLVRLPEGAQLGYMDRNPGTAHFWIPGSKAFLVLEKGRVIPRMLAERPREASGLSSMPSSRSSPSFRPHTSASDLSFFLVMPVQRVTKYPLLLGKILENTPASTSSHAALAAAVRAMTQVNANINEYKRRREVGEQGHISGRGHGTGSGWLGRLSSTLVASHWCCTDSYSSQFKALPFSCPSAILPGGAAGWAASQQLLALWNLAQGGCCTLGKLQEQGGIGASTELVHLHSLGVEGTILPLG